MDDKPRWLLQIAARIVAVSITFVPALGKFTIYSRQVAEFEMWGIPYPEIMVPIVETVQMLAIASITFGFAGRYGAATLAVVMIVAMWAVGFSVLNVPVFLSCLTIVLLGTGPSSRWDPPLPILGYPLAGPETTS